MNDDFTLFEVSWEVANKVGGIHTVVATKAKTLVERFGDRYVAIGPWLMNERRQSAVEDEPGFHGFSEACRAMGVPVRVGRWRIPGRPRVILVDSSRLLERKDAILARLWDVHRVDSLFGQWDYVEPVLFGHAAGMVIHRYFQEFVSPLHEEAVAQFHEWMTGAGLLYLKSQAPAVGTVFTTHATVLGRALSAAGQTPEDGLKGKTPDAVAEALGVRSKHSMEGVVAREADVLTTVSEVTAFEVDLVHRRLASPVLPNGIDVEVVEEVAGPATRADVRETLVRLASGFLGEDVSDAALLATAGRYEFHNKGIDLLLDALAEVQKGKGHRAVLFAFVPAGCSGVRKEVLDRFQGPEPEANAPGLGLSTHNLFDAEGDPIGRRCRERGLGNARGSRVFAIHVPCYLSPEDGLLSLPYEAVLRGTDLTLFPSFYEPWGYTPAESLAVGVPTVTSDRAGFGRWAIASRVSPADGVAVLKRRGTSDEEAAKDLAARVESFLRADLGASAPPEACRETARRLSWEGLVANYEAAFAAALAGARLRTGTLAFARGGPPSLPRAPWLPRERIEPEASPLPTPLAALARLSRNLWWTWDWEAGAVFEELDPARWEACGHDPVVLLRDAAPPDLAKKGADAAYAARVAAVAERFDRYVAGAAGREEAAAWAPVSRANPVAYFCAEFGVHESLHVYNGGLGVLAGDHLKSASDLGLPLVGVGLFYRKGYMRQRVSARGDQVPIPFESDPRDLPLDLVRDEAGRVRTVSLALPGSTLTLVAWRAAVGRVPLYLLDADVPENRPEDRAITHVLYGGDHELRLRQEIVLGKGGMRLLDAIGVRPAVIHLNEGHAALAPLERIGRLVRDEGLTFDEALEVVRATTVFTTHTPVPAGHDRFAEDLVRRYFSDCEAWVGLPWARFFALGHGGEDRSAFNMTYLATRLSRSRNGVSRLHGVVSRRLLAPFWPALLEQEIPVSHVTNGVHLPTWTAPPMARLLGADSRPVRGFDFESRGASLDARALWEARSAARLRLLATVKHRVETAFRERQDDPALLARILDGLTDRALLVGFARRFAAYKRADLLLKDLPRLTALLSSDDRPVRVFVAGKAHPKDGPAQDLLRSIVAASRSSALAGRLVFLEDYDLDLARALVQGVDLWLNTPLRGLEASGTSGMKVVANGGLHASVRDGWWEEGFDGGNGWAIGDARAAPTRDVEDDLDSSSLLSLLEGEIVPLFFDRDEYDVPRGWMERVKRSLATLPARFDSDRMVREYRDKAYRPLAHEALSLTIDGYAPARLAAARRARIRKGFPSVRILSVHRPAASADAAPQASAEIDLGPLAPEDVVVELVSRGSPILDSAAGTPPKPGVLATLHPAGESKGTVRVFRGVARVPALLSVAVRVRPRPESPSDDGLADLGLWSQPG